MNVIERARAILDAHARMTAPPLAVHQHREPMGDPPAGVATWFEVYTGAPPRTPDATPVGMVASFCEMTDDDEPNAAGFVVLHTHAAELARAYAELREAATSVLANPHETSQAMLGLIRVLSAHEGVR
jgi:hypothetical protein